MILNVISVLVIDIYIVIDIDFEKSIFVKKKANDYI
jgi:hypothetical protein